MGCRFCVTRQQLELFQPGVKQEADVALAESGDCTDFAVAEIGIEAQANDLLLVFGKTFQQTEKVPVVVIACG